MVEQRVLINRASLSQTVDAINSAHFYGDALAAAGRAQAAPWIAVTSDCDAAASDRRPRI